MIAYLNGEVIYKQAPVIILKTNNIGYEILVPMSVYYNLPDLNLAENNNIELYIYNHIREDSNVLYGFSNINERRLFIELLKINGVGPRLALTILSNYTVEEFITVINNSELNKLIKLPGVGKKTAERLLLELKDKLQKIINSFGFNQDYLNNLNSNISNYDNYINNNCNSVLDAIAALEVLGYKSNDAKKVIGKINNNNILSSEDLIKAALKEFN